MNAVHSIVPYPSNHWHNFFLGKCIDFIVFLICQLKIVKQRSTPFDAHIHNVFCKLHKMKGETHNCSHLYLSLLVIFPFFPPSSLDLCYSVVKQNIRHFFLWSSFSIL